MDGVAFASVGPAEETTITGADVSEEPEGEAVDTNTRPTLSGLPTPNASFLNASMYAAGAGDSTPLASAVHSPVLTPTPSTVHAPTLRSIGHRPSSSGHRSTSSVASSSGTHTQQQSPPVAQPQSQLTPRKEQENGHVLHAVTVPMPGHRRYQSATHLNHPPYPQGAHRRTTSKASFAGSQAQAGGEEGLVGDMEPEVVGLPREGVTPTEKDAEPVAVDEAVVPASSPVLAETAHAQRPRASSTSSTDSSGSSSDLEEEDDDEDEDDEEDDDLEGEEEEKRRKTAFCAGVEKVSRHKE